MHLNSQGPPKFFKSVLKKGDKTNFPKKGDNVSCWYTGSLEDGTVFDTNIPASMFSSHTSVTLTQTHADSDSLTISDTQFHPLGLSHTHVLSL